MRHGIGAVQPLGLALRRPPVDSTVQRRRHNARTADRDNEIARRPDKGPARKHFAMTLSPREESVTRVHSKTEHREFGESTGANVYVGKGALAVDYGAFDCDGDGDVDPNIIRGKRIK